MFDLSSFESQKFLRKEWNVLEIFLILRFKLLSKQQPMYKVCCFILVVIPWAFFWGKKKNLKAKAFEFSIQQTQKGTVGSSFKKPNPNVLGLQIENSNLDIFFETVKKLVDFKKDYWQLFGQRKFKKKPCLWSKREK